METTHLPGRSVDPTFGTGPITGTPSGLDALTRSGVLLRGTTSAQDILGFTAATSATWQSRWRVHPGGNILTLSAYGDAFLTTTSMRTVVGYGADGTRRWTLSLPEVVLAPAVRASDTEAVLVTLGGEVINDRHRDRSDPLAHHARVRHRRERRGGRRECGDRRPSPDIWSRSGHPTAPRSGARRRPTPPVALAAAATSVLLVGDADVDSFAAADGTMRWRAGFPDSASAPTPTPFAGGVVLLTNAGAQALDGAGRTRWVRGGVYGLTVGGDDLVCWAPARPRCSGPTRPP